MKILLFVNDSYFSYLLARPVVERFRHDIRAVVFSTMITGSPMRIFSLYKKTYPGYFFYRSMVSIISGFISLYKHKSVASMAREYGLPVLSESSVNKSEAIGKLLPADLGLTFNFDQIIGERLLASFGNGVINVHASRLPSDKGVSPVLWAFARGDHSVWSTVYRMDKGIDCGLVYRQFEVPVEERDTAFSLYERVCERSGRELVEVVEALSNGTLEPISVSTASEGNYWGWPDKTHRDMMGRSGRYFLRLADIIRSVRRG